MIQVLNQEQKTLDVCLQWSPQSETNSTRPTLPNASLNLGAYDFTTKSHVKNKIPLHMMNNTYRCDLPSVYIILNMSVK